MVEFLWASLALFDDDTAAADTATVYQARPFELYAVAEARERILQLLAEAPEGAPLERFLPDLAKISEREVWAKIRLRSAWSSTFIAGLELAKQGEVVLGQGGISRPSISVRSLSGRPSEPYTLTLACVGRNPLCFGAHPTDRERLAKAPS